jgi:hypothetical protein
VAVHPRRGKEKLILQDPQKSYLQSVTDLATKDHLLHQSNCCKQKTLQTKVPKSMNDE